MERIKIKSKTIKPFKGSVYDIEVKEDHTYIVSDCVVHNSAAGSLILYVLGISTIDPIKYGLFFERFLSESRSVDCVLDYFSEAI